MFLILEDRRGRLSHAPAKWVKVAGDNREIIYWPKKNQFALQNDPESEPVLEGEYKWLIINDKIKRRGLASKEAAEAEIDRMMEYPKTETEVSEEENEGQTGESVSTRRKSKVLNHKQPAVIPKFEIKNLMHTPPASALKNVIISSGAVTPTTGKYQKTPLSQVNIRDIQTTTPPQSLVNTPTTGENIVYPLNYVNQQEVAATPPSALLTDAFLGMSPITNTVISGMTDDMNLNDTSAAPTEKNVQYLYVQPDGVNYFFS